MQCTKSFRDRCLSWLIQRLELTRSGVNQNVRIMEGLRGLAIFLVFLVHYSTLIQPWISGRTSMVMLTEAMRSMGNVGVDLFFVLSGYLIYGSLITKPVAFGHFMARRVRRIYPGFIVVFVMYVALSMVFSSESKIPSDPLSGGIYLLQNFFLLPGIFPINPMITVAWSLSYEMFYYLAVPLFIQALGLRDRSAVWRIVFLVALAGAGLVAGALWGGPVRLVMFISGMVLFDVCRSKQVKTPPTYLGLLALSVGLLGTLVPLPGTSGFALRMGTLFVAFFVLCLACFRNDTSWLARSFSWLPLRWLGNISYSYYLLHGLALKFAFLVLSSLIPASGQQAWLFWLALPLLFVWTIFPCGLLFLTVERPYSLAARH